MTRIPKILRLTINGDRTTILSTMRYRLMIISFITLCVYGVLFMRLFDLSIIQAKSEAFFAAQHENSRPRPNIYDRNGVLLASTIKSKSLAIRPQLIMNQDNVLKNLPATLPKIDQDDLIQALKHQKKYKPLLHDLTADEIQKVMAFGEPGLIIESQDKRYYPQEAMTSHIIGYTSRDHRGLAGLEFSLDQDDKKKTSKTDDLHLTLDTRVQNIVHQELKKAITKFKAKGAVGIVIDVKNGDLLASVSLPDFDPNRPIPANSPQLFNKSTQGVYELGSVFKLFSTAAYLEKFGPQSIASEFDASKPLIRGRFTIRDHHGKNRVLSLAETFMVSSNIGTGLMAEKLGQRDLKDFYNSLGFMDPLRITLPEKSAPMIPANWSNIHTITTSYGHGIAVTPMHVAYAAASILNDGCFVKPQLIFQKEREEQSCVQLVSLETSKLMREMLHLVVSHGTARKAQIDGLSIGGKTGTAEKTKQTGRGYDKGRLMTNFIAAFPIQDPQYIVYVVLDEPQPLKIYDTAAGHNASPTARTIIKKIAPLLRVPFESTKSAFYKPHVNPLYRYIRIN